MRRAARRLGGGCIAVSPWALQPREDDASRRRLREALGPKAMIRLDSNMQWSLATALSLLVWYVYAPQCLSTIAVIKRETNSWKQAGIATFYLFALAYLASFITYQTAKALL